MSDPGASSRSQWIQITLESPLPTITEEVHIDGSTQTTNVGNTNPIALGSSTTVGANETPLTQVEAPEIVITPNRTNNIYIDNAFRVSSHLASNTEINSLSLFGFGPATLNSNSAYSTIYIEDQANFVQIHDNILGTLPTSNLLPPTQSNNGPLVSTNGDVNSTKVNNNIFAHSEGTGLFLYNNDNLVNDQIEVIIRNNEFFELGNTSYGTNAVEIQNRTETVTPIIENNLIRDSMDCVDFVALFGGTIDNASFINNTLQNCTTNGSDSRSFGISLRGVQNSTIDSNLITEISGTGILNRSYENSTVFREDSFNNTFTANNFNNNSELNIDNINVIDSVSTLGDGFNPIDAIYNPEIANEGVDRPTINTAYYLSNSEQLYITGESQTDGYIEIYYTEGSNSWSSLVTINSSSSTFTDTIDLSSSEFESGASVIATTFIDNAGNTSEFSESIAPETIDIRELETEINLNSLTESTDNNYNINYEVRVDNFNQELDLVDIETTLNLNELLNNDSITVNSLNLESENFPINQNFDGINDTNVFEQGYDLQVNSGVIFQAFLDVTIKSDSTFEITTHSEGFSEEISNLNFSDSDGYNTTLNYTESEQTNETTSEEEPTEITDSSEVISAREESEESSEEGSTITNESLPATGFTLIPSLLISVLSFFGVISLNYLKKER